MLENLKQFEIKKEQLVAITGGNATPCDANDTLCSDTGGGGSGGGDGGDTK